MSLSCFVTAIKDHGDSMQINMRQKQKRVGTACLPLDPQTRIRNRGSAVFKHTTQHHQSIWLQDAVRQYRTLLGGTGE